MNSTVGRYDYDPTSFSCAAIFGAFSWVTEYVWHTQDIDDGDPHDQSIYPIQSHQPQKIQIQLESPLNTHIQIQLQSQPKIYFNYLLQHIQSQTEKNTISNINTNLNAFNFQHFKQDLQFAFTILDFKFANYNIQSMQQVLMGNPVIVALIFGIILIMSLCPITISTDTSETGMEIISEVLISYWLYIWLNITEFIEFQLVIFNCVVFCFFVLNVILFFSERIINSDWCYRFRILIFLFRFGKFCFKVWYFWNSCNGIKETIIDRINRKRWFIIGNSGRGVKDR